MRAISNLIKKKLSDFFINVSASSFFAISIAPGFKNQNIIDFYLTVFYYLFLAIIYFIFSIIILKNKYE